MATQTMQAMGPTMDGVMARKPLPSLPSPTLTNPDMVLPNEYRPYAPVNSPPRYGRRERPPSPSYLRDTTPESKTQRSGSSGSTMATPKKEKRGLMSRKMMLLRSRTASSGVQVAAPEPAHDDFANFDSAYGSSPTLMDVGNLAPEQPDHRRVSVGGSSVDSDDMSSLPQFLAKYESQDAVSTDDEDEVLTPTYEPSIDGGLEAQRKKQEEDEHTSALLSQRAEQILANAKKRLNLMEGNLRGARDLVAPLTSANLKRATSVGSSYATPTRTYGPRNRAVYDRPHYERTNTRMQHRLSTQASAPHLAEDYYQGHSRGFSETEIPDRPYTALEHNVNSAIANAALPVSASDPALNYALRGSKSYDSLGVVRRRTSRDTGSPNLEPLAEDDGQYHAVSTPMDRRGSGDGSHGSQRSDSRTEDLREQMSSLKGRISSLRDRAREDSLRRQSMINLREPSPLNNAVAYSPEFFYTSSPSYGRPALDTNAGIGSTSKENSPIVAKGPSPTWSPDQMFRGSRNAFAEMEQRAHQHDHEGQQRRGSENNLQKSSRKQRRPSTDNQDQVTRSFHKRTPSGTAIVQSSKHRYSHHESQRSVELKSGIQHGQGLGIATDTSAHVSDDQSEAGDSVYEDASSSPPAPVVAHEDRADAFDYKSFFLLSAQRAYGRRESTSSEASTTSTATARGPTAAGADDDVDTFHDGDSEFDDLDSDIYPPPSPETPERLREIERNLHKRTFSSESTSTVATFATATEGRGSPDDVSSATDWPMRSATSRTNSRPSTAIFHNKPSNLSNIARSDSSSERADSGVGGLPHRSHSSQSTKRIATRASPVSPPIASPPMSPRTLADPATVAVNALIGLGSGGRPLGLKDKALLFGAVESLGRVVRRLQEEECDGVELRRRLERARRALEGG